MNHYLAALILCLFACSTLGTHRSIAAGEQGDSVLSSMSLEQSAAWLRKTLLGLGTQRIVVSVMTCDITVTGVRLDRGALTIETSETCKTGTERWDRKATMVMALADIDAGKVMVSKLEVDNTPPGVAFVLKFAMAAGKTARTTQVWTQSGKTEKKDFQKGEQEVYIGSQEKAYQAADVLRRMIALSSSQTR